MPTRRVKVYTVIRTTEDPEDVNNDTEIRGTFRTLEEANEAVRTDFDDDHYGNFNDQRFEMSGGVATATAIGGEGEDITVFIKENWQTVTVREDPPPRQRQPAPRAVAQAPPTQPRLQIPSVYIIMMRIGPRKGAIIHSVHASVASANLTVPHVARELTRDGRIAPNARVTQIRGLDGLPHSTVIKEPGKGSWDLVSVEEKQVMNNVAADGDQEEDSEEDQLDSD